jgi:hypothetical protein
MHPVFIIARMRHLYNGAGMDPCPNVERRILSHDCLRGFDRGWDGREPQPDDCAQCFRLGRTLAKDCGQPH